MTESTAHPAPGTRIMGRIARVYLALSAAFQIETLLIPPRQDSAAWLFMAARQEYGQMPGRDLWDNKLPLTYLIGRAAHASGHPQLFLWLLESAVTAAGGMAVFAAARRMTTPRAATVAGGLLCVASGAPAFHAGGYMTEIYAMPLSAIAVWLGLCSLDRPGRVAHALGAGLAW